MTPTSQRSGNCFNGRDDSMNNRDISRDISVTYITKPVTTRDGKHTRDDP